MIQFVATAYEPAQEQGSYDCQRVGQAIKENDGSTTNSPASPVVIWEPSTVTEPGNSTVPLLSIHVFLV